MMATEQVSVLQDCILYRKYKVNMAVTIHASYSLHFLKKLLADSFNKQRLFYKTLIFLMEMWCIFLVVQLIWMHCAL
jgi:hypothetical protein